MRIIKHFVRDYKLHIYFTNEKHKSYKMQSYNYTFFRPSLNQFNRTEVIWNEFSDPNVIKLDINKISRKTANIFN